MIRLFCALFIGKCVYGATKYLMKSGGSAAPGLIALKIDPRLIQKLAKQIKTNVVVTGTNGKTTTSAILAQMLQGASHVIHNNTGSNLSRGVASTLINASSLFGSVFADVGVWEADEAAFVHLVKEIRPEHIVILNLARDQLDRYGEIDTVVKKWKRTLQDSLWKKTLYINADDGYVYDLHTLSSQSLYTFGIEESPVHFEKKSKNPHYDTKARILDATLDHVEFVFSFQGFGMKARLPMAGSYNVYNFLAAHAVGVSLGLETDYIVHALSVFTPAFGRMEHVRLNEKKGLIALIKNPAGASQVFQTISPLVSPNDSVVIILNDLIADGTDVSWIWDVQFEQFKDKTFHIHVVGTRRYDIALRLHYAGISKKRIFVHQSIHNAIQKTQKGNGSLFFLPTYTALLELQSYLKKHNYKSTYWHE